MSACDLVTLKRCVAAAARPASPVTEWLDSFAPDCAIQHGKELLWTHRTCIVGLLEAQALHREQPELALEEGKQ